jgi:hypothetical protein
VLCTVCMAHLLEGRECAVLSAIPCSLKRVYVCERDSQSRLGRQRCFSAASPARDETNDTAVSLAALVTSETDRDDETKSTVGPYPRHAGSGSDVAVLCPKLGA